MDIYQHLISDHEKQRRLLRAVVEACGDVANRHRLLETLCDELEAHAAAEEQTLYAELLTLSKTHIVVQHHVNEHDTAMKEIATLCQMECSCSEWLAQFQHFRSALDCHLNEEEWTTFRQAKLLIRQNRAMTLGAEFKMIKRRHCEAWGGAPLTDRTTPA